MEFEEKDYAEALSYAKNIKDISLSINDIFNSISSQMSTLAQSSWTSKGSADVLSAYGEIRANYTKFLEKVELMVKHINEITGANIEADKAASTEVVNRTQDLSSFKI